MLIRQEGKQALGIRHSSARSLKEVIHWKEAVRFDYTDFSSEFNPSDKGVSSRCGTTPFPGRLFSLFKETREDRGAPGHWQLV